MSVGNGSEVVSAECTLHRARHRTWLRLGLSEMRGRLLNHSLIRLHGRLQQRRDLRASRIVRHRDYRVLTQWQMRADGFGAR
jgi:hypothetical protein